MTKLDDRIKAVLDQRRDELLALADGDLNTEVSYIVIDWTTGPRQRFFSQLAAAHKHLALSQGDNHLRAIPTPGALPLVKFQITVHHVVDEGEEPRITKFFEYYEDELQAVVEVREMFPGEDAIVVREVKAQE